MKKIVLFSFILLYGFIFAGCTLKGVETDYAAAIMVNDKIYYLTAQELSAEIEESAIIGYTESYTDTFPKKNNQTNFCREPGMAIAEVEDGIAVLYNNEWRLCIPEENAIKGGTIVYYSKPTKEFTEPSEKEGIDLTKKQAKELQSIIDTVDNWTDDHLVDRLAYYFDGYFELADDGYKYYFTYEYNVIYYDHYYAEIPEEDMQYIKELNFN